MDDAAVVPGLVLRDLSIFFQDDYLVARVLLRESHGGCKPDNARSNYCNVISLKVHNLSVGAVFRVWV